MRGILDFQSFNSEYVAKLAARDAETEKDFADYFGPLLVTRLRGRLRSREAVEDARQETLLRVLTNVRRQGGLDDPQKLGAYVYRTCNNVLLETYRSQKRYGQAEDVVPEQADWRPDPESEWVTEERRRVVRSVMEELNGKDRALLQGAFLEEKDKEELCAEWGVDGDYLRVLLHRARGRFKAILLKKHGGSL